jgi:hypothetical protein
MLDIQATACACFLTRCSEGINIAINNAIMAITTKSSIKVKPLALCTILALLFALFVLTRRVYQKADQIARPVSFLQL